ncbi:MAG: peptidylprolyl isomerase [Gemmatimonadaceae bacterium]|nr:peptidylprolyl isomerase [Gemmatimonadaceae bacterium]MCW5825612.1 peptidylprolyl isomerase [Gemmatimonadaceae bacterium]
MNRLRLALIAVLLSAATACGAIKDAMTAHVDVVARAGTAELTVSEFAEMLANTGVSLEPSVVRSISQVWVNYQLLGHAAARGDTLRDSALADRGMWSTIQQMRLQRMFQEHLATMAPVDTARFRKAYEDGEMLGAAHILLTKQPAGLGTAVNDSIKREAEQIARTVTSATFARVARARSQDPGSKDRGGDYGVFSPGTMVPEFESAIRAVAPGGITGVVETQFGYHIIRRSTWDEVRAQFTEEYTQFLQSRAESTFFADAEKGVNLQVRRNAPRVVKAIAEDVDAFRRDRTVIATSRVFDLTAGRMADWIGAFPPQAQIRPQIMQAADSLIPDFVANIMRNELLLRRADSLGLQPDSATLIEVRDAFYTTVTDAMEALGLSPAQLAEASTVSDREKLATERATAYIRGLFTSSVQYVDVPEPVSLVLRERYEARIVPAGLDRVVAEATRLRAAAEAAAEAGAAPTAVPLPAPNP